MSVFDGTNKWPPGGAIAGPDGEVYTGALCERCYAEPVYREIEEYGKPTVKAKLGYVCLGEWWASRPRFKLVIEKLNEVGIDRGRVTQEVRDLVLGDLGGHSVQFEVGGATRRRRAEGFRTGGWATADPARGPTYDYVSSMFDSIGYSGLGSDAFAEMLRKMATGYQEAETLTGERLRRERREVEERDRKRREADGARRRYQERKAARAQRKDLEERLRTMGYKGREPK